jgi:NADH dehydrogenase (ubiquinone) Fe-S protein 1
VSLGQLWPGAQELSRTITSSASALQQAAPQAPPSDQIEVFVNDQSVKVAKNSSVIQACDAAGIDIPR